MMRILHLYILRRFVVTLLFAIIFFVVIVICVDMVGNLARFIDKDVPTLIIAKYYLYYIPFIINGLGLPMAMLLASMVCVGQMTKYNELAAIKSAGISLNRLFLAVFIFALFVSVMALIFAEKVVPVANQGKTGIEDEYLEPNRVRSSTMLTNLLLHDNIGRRIFIAKYNTRTKIAKRVTIQTYKGNLIDERIDIKSMRWQDDAWVMKSGYKRIFTNGVEEATSFSNLTDPNLYFTPEQLAEKQVKPDDMSYFELQKFIREVTKNGGDPRKWQVDLNFKLAMPLANFILVLFGAPLASHKQRSGAVLGLILSSGIFLVYFGMMRFVQTLGQLGKVPPVTAAWLTNGIFFCLGLLILAKARR